MPLAYPVSNQQGQVVGAVDGQQLYAGGTPPEAKPFPTNAFLAIVGAAAAAGAAFVGFDDIAEMFDGGATITETRDTADNMIDYLQGKNSFMQFGEDVADSATETVEKAVGGISGALNGGKEFISDIPENFGEFIGNIGRNELSESVNDAFRVVRAEDLADFSMPDKFDTFVTQAPEGEVFHFNDNLFAIKGSDDLLLMGNVEKVNALDPEMAEGFLKGVDGLDVSTIPNLQTNQGIDFSNIATGAGIGTTAGVVLGGAALQSNKRTPSQTMLPTTAIANIDYQQPLMQPVAMRGAPA